MEREERIVRYSAEEIDEMLLRGESKTDWDRVDALTDEEIEASIDFKDEGDFDGARAYKGLPPGIDFGPPKEEITIRLDGEIIDWFKTRGREYPSMMNAVLRRYVNEHKRD